MMRIKEQNAESFTLEVSGKLTRDDYEAVLPDVEQIVQEHGKVRALVELNEFTGWSPTGMVDELKFDVRHRKDIEKVAILGDNVTEEALARIAQPIFAGEVKFFPKTQINEAKRWLAAS